MKQFLWIVAIGWLVAIFVSACGTVGESTPSPTAVRVAMGVNMPPFESLNTYTFEFEGFDVDLIEAIADRTGLEIEIVESEYNLLLTLVGQCEFDAGISAIPISETLKSRVDFSEPYLQTNHSLVVKKGNLVITGVDSLDGMRVSTQLGSPSELELRKLTGIEPETNGTFTAAFQDLAAGYVDAVIADTYRAERYAEIKPYNLQVVGESFGDPVSYGIAVCKDRPDVLETINEGLRILEEDGTLRRLTRKWITNRFQ